MQVCEPDKVIEHAKEIDYSNSPSTGDATVICEEGYIAKPSSTMVCLYDQWTIVECVPIGKAFVVACRLKPAIYIYALEKYNFITMLFSYIGSETDTDL